MEVFHSHPGLESLIHEATASLCPMIGLALDFTNGPLQAEMTELNILLRKYEFGYKNKWRHSEFNGANSEGISEAFRFDAYGFVSVGFFQIQYRY